jgi:Beta-lactamase class C and other penicillin binding proteins
MNIYRKKLAAGFMTVALLLGLAPGSLALADTSPNTETDTKTEVITPSGLTADALESTIDAYVKKYVGTKVPGAAVTITKDKEVLFNKGYGYCDLEEKITMDPDTTVVGYGDFSQIYTWVAALQLVEQGKLDLEADILTYIPEDFATELKKHLIGTAPITLTTLMNHTAGFEEIEHDNTFDDSSKLESDLKQALLKTMPDQVYGPGQIMTGDTYSVALAAYIIEQVSGTSFTEYVQTNILDKIGANHTVFMQKESVAKALEKQKAIQYGMDIAGNFVPDTTTFSNLYPANAVYGTTSDLV